MSKPQPREAVPSELDVVQLSEGVKLKEKKTKRRKAEEVVDPSQAEDVTILEPDAVQLSESVKPKEKKRKKRKVAEGVDRSQAEDATTDFSAADTGESKPEKKLKDKRRHENEKTREPEVAEGDGDGENRTKLKKKRKGNEDRHAVVEPNAGPGPSVDGVETSEKNLVVDKVKGYQVHGEDSSGESEVLSRESRKKERAREEERLMDAKDAERTKKKEEKKKRKEVAEDETTTTVAHKPKQKKHKSHSNRLGFANPSQDESLADQSRKALGYAFVYITEPEKWKFNKARQNWLIRNVWSSDAIPEVYMPLLTRYLAGVQGGVREILLKTCRDLLASPSQMVPSTDAAEPSTNEPAVVADASATKQLRAAALVAVLELVDEASSVDHQ
ncbi:hypothetical protein SCP_0206040 [Sparassis crispa]|uniref:WKF domain-containing protein n=1 Tax=Sparassis crispa TaxID=139825 RepID=A0A401GB45_9APHY|nr:hypothetical protein SCP_0206040 [Sparassis crispa]GBE79406.1 hypothetical protein SCP_0206040 [Sparassis crispa]